MARRHWQRQTQSHTHPLTHTNTNISIPTDTQSDERDRCTVKSRDREGETDKHIHTSSQVASIRHSIIRSPFWSLLSPLRHNFLNSKCPSSESSPISAMGETSWGGEVLDERVVWPDQVCEVSLQGGERTYYALWTRGLICIASKGISGEERWELHSGRSVFWCSTYSMVYIRRYGYG